MLFMSPLPEHNTKPLARGFSTAPVWSKAGSDDAENASLKFGTAATEIKLDSLDTVGENISTPPAFDDSPAAKMVFLLRANPEITFFAEETGIDFGTA